MPEIFDVETRVAVRIDYDNPNTVFLLSFGEWVPFVKKQICHRIVEPISTWKADGNPHCSECHGWLDTSFKYCPSCGAEVRK